METGFSYPVACVVLLAFEQAHSKDDLQYSFASRSSHRTGRLKEKNNEFPIIPPSAFTAHLIGQRAQREGNNKHTLSSFSSSCIPAFQQPPFTEPLSSIVNNRHSPRRFLLSGPHCTHIFPSVGGVIVLLENSKTTRLVRISFSLSRRRISGLWFVAL